MQISEFQRSQESLGLYSEPLHGLQAREENCATLHGSRIFLLIKAFSDSKPFPKGKGRNHLLRSVASNLSDAEIDLTESHSETFKHF